MADNKIIYADKLQKAIVDDVTIKGRAFAAAMRHIQDAQAIDPVHAAGGCYCRECKRIEKMKCNNTFFCNRYGGEVSKSDFCSRGERREGE